jgi:dUTP pyrophosphatase
MHFGEARISKIFPKEKNQNDRENKKMEIKTAKPGPVPTLRIFRSDKRARLPERAHPNSVGLDIFAFLLTESGRATTRAIHQRGVTAVPTGLILRPPAGFYVQCCSRSGLAAKGVFVANAPGIIDPDYTGELIVLLFNGSFETHYVAHEHRIAQIFLSPIPHCDLMELDERPAHQGRGEAGFGSTGL